MTTIDPYDKHKIKAFQISNEDELAAEFEEEEDGVEFQRIRARISNTLNLPIDNLDKSTGVAINPAQYVHNLVEPSDDLVTIFRRMLDLGSPDYQHQLATFLHNGPPKMEYVYIKEEDRWVYRGKPDVKTLDEELIAAVAAKVKAERDAADMANKTIIVTKREDLNILTNEKFDFECYIPDCKFVTNCKSIYERHVLTKHPGKLCYPGKVDLKQRGWTAQGRKWEI